MTEATAIMLQLTLGLGVAVGLWALATKVRPRAKRAECGWCRYGVDGLPTSHCPECAADLSVVGIVRPGHKRPLSTTKRHLAALALMTVIVALVSYHVARAVGSLRALRRWSTTSTSVWRHRSAPGAPMEVTSYWGGKWRPGQGVGIPDFYFDGPDEVVAKLSGPAGTGILRLERRAEIYRLSGPDWKAEGRWPPDCEVFRRWWVAVGHLDNGFVVGPFGAADGSWPKRGVPFDTFNFDEFDYWSSDWHNVCSWHAVVCYDFLNQLSWPPINSATSVPFGLNKAPGATSSSVGTAPWVMPTAAALVWPVWCVLLRRRLGRWRAERAHIERTRLGSVPGVDLGTTPSGEARTRA